MMPSLIDISIRCATWSERLEHLEDRIAESVKATLAAVNFPQSSGAEISVVLADDDFIHTLNRDYRGKDTPTNVLSFPQYTAEELISAKNIDTLGDVILAYETIHGEAIQQGKAFRDHTTHLLVHGLLHLLGFDHEEEKQAQEMEALEIRILDDLGIKNPYEIRDPV